MSDRIFQVDAFTDKPFYGNPAAVCLLSMPKDENWMQKLAMEMNLSETAFILKQSDGFSLRWFTPVCEVALCGHATLASAFTLWEENVLGSNEEIRFHTKSGVLTANMKEDHLIELDFPAEPVKPVKPPLGLEEALGVKWNYSGKNKTYYLFEVDSEEIVQNAKPNFERLKLLMQEGIIITSKCTSEKFDFISRVFVPSQGINEDPVTGSAHCALCPYWAEKYNKNKLSAYQASQRGGVLEVRTDMKRVFINGKAVMIFRGSLSKKV